MLDEENEMYYLGKSAIDLTPLETRTLAYFIENKGKVVRYKDITREILGTESETSPPRLTQIICRLNKKLKYELCIQARTSIGYKLEYIGKRVL